MKLLNASGLIDELLLCGRVTSLLAVDPYGNAAIYQILSLDADTFPRMAVFEDDREYTRFADDVPIEESVRFRIDLYARENILAPLNSALHEAMRGLGFRRAGQVEDGYIDEIGVYVKSATYEIREQLPFPWD